MLLQLLTELRYSVPSRMTHEESNAAAILATAGTIEEGEAEEEEEDSEDEILNNPDKFRDESLGTLPAVRVRQDNVLLFLPLQS